MIDVSIRASLLNMLSRLKEQFGVTFLFQGMFRTSRYG